MKRENLIKTLKTLVPDDTPVTEDTLQAADAALADNAAIITYIRGNHKVERVVIAEQDAPPKSKLVICSGEPKAVLIAFAVDNKLFIGWAKRNEDVVLVKDNVYKKFIKDLLVLSPAADAFAQSIQAFAKNVKLKDKETTFSKQLGRYIAFHTAGTEVLAFKGTRLYSTRCGLVPDVVSKMLPRFIARAEKVSGLKAVNVKYEDKTKLASV
jgi:hypothetical protein